MEIGSSSNKYPRLSKWETPPPQLQAFGITGAGFDMGLWIFIPGVYRVEATSDFSSWTPVVTATNATGFFRVKDTAAPLYPVAFAAQGESLSESGLGEVCVYGVVTPSTSAGIASILGNSLKPV